MLLLTSLMVVSRPEVGFSQAAQVAQRLAFITRSILIVEFPKNVRILDKKWYAFVLLGRLITSLS